MLHHKISPTVHIKASAAHKRHNLVSVTRAFFEIFDFFSENVVKKCGKGQKLGEKVKIYVIKYNLLDFYYKIWIKFSNFHNCGNSGHTKASVVVIVWK